MCGILGFLKRGGVRPTDALALSEQMGKVIAHRGPDDHGEWCDADAGIAFGQRRLSINDLSPAGHQPMISASGRYVIVLNGEIYNFLELRAELERAGYPFRGDSDTEVALALIERDGFADSLRQFVGMFAIGLWDREARTLSLARDRLGEKPLYYGIVVGLMMQHVYGPAPRTIYTGVKKLLPGTWLTVDAGNMTAAPAPESYWPAAELAAAAMAAREPIDDQSAIDALDGLLRHTIRDKMISDVPLGAFLSGGVDSSTVVALMQAESMDQVKTFSIGFAEGEFNEADEAKRVAEHLGTEHTELYVSPEEAQAVIPQLPHLYSEPFADSSQIPTYLVSALARRRVTVALSGDGGDELFGGYTRYLLAENMWQRFERMPGPLRAGLGKLAGMLPAATVDQLVAPLKPLMPEHWRYKQFGNKLHKLALICGSNDSQAVYKSLISMWLRPSQVVIGAGDVDMLAELPAIIASVPNFTERMMLMDLLSYLPGDILAKVDRASMGESLEVRVPFLDHRVVEHAWTVPFDQKVRGTDGKWLLKQVLYRYVPRALIERPKMGFGVPVGEWLRGPLREWAEALLDERRLREEGYFHPAEVRGKWQEHLSGKADWHYLLWPVLMYQAWFEHYERSG